MNGSSGTLVFWLLVPLFVAIGIYLVLYSRRRKRMLEAFAKTHRLSVRPEYESDLQKKLDDCFSLEAKGLVRSFAQLSSIVDGGRVCLFRAVELLDINPHAQSYSTHYPRIAAVFDMPTRLSDAFFVLDKTMRVNQRLPETEPPNSDGVETLKRIAQSCEARHSLSVTFAHGHGLIYFEPLVTGGETMSDVNSLYCIAQKMCEHPSSDV